MQSFAAKASSSRTKDHVRNHQPTDVRAPTRAQDQNRISSSDFSADARPAILSAGLQDASSPRTGPSPPDNIQRQVPDDPPSPDLADTGYALRRLVCPLAIFPSGRISIS